MTGSLNGSTLWGWGDNAQGGNGIGTELNFATTTQPYAWDYYPADLLQQSPVQVTTRKDFVAIFAIQPFDMYDYAETADGSLYSWGRNKGGVLGNGIVGCSSDVVATYLVITSDNNGPVRVNIYDMNGKLLKSLQLIKTTTYFNQSLNTGNLTAGMYIVKTYVGNTEQFTTKFIKL